ncbi:PAS domain S-box protein [bacterium]|nr:PAS domain S-box protein [bacterium]
MKERDFKEIDLLKEVANPSTLMEAFEVFNQVSSKLMDSYEKLKIEASRLKVEVEEKNEELRKNLEENKRLRISLENIIQSITSGMIVVDKMGKITLSNKNAERIIGTSKKKLSGSSYIEFFRNIPDVGVLKKSGDKLLPFGLEFSFINTKGEKYILGMNISSVHDEGKGSGGYILDFRDLKNLKALEEKAERVTRLTAMGEMAAKMAHEIRNPLGSIELFASLLKKQLVDFPERAEIADNIISGVKNLNRTVTNILQYSKPSEAVAKGVEIEKIIEDVLLFSKQKVTDDNIKIATKFSKIRYPAEGDSELLKQMFFNIILNAFQAMPEGGTLTISTSYRNAKESDLKKIVRNNTKIKVPVFFLRINFKDTGIGIEDEDLKNIFHPFFTTKKRGTGLGLSIIDKIVQQHNGSINIKSKKGAGTLVSVELPVYV